MQPRILQIQGTQLLEAPSTPATHATKAGPVTITQPALAASTAAEHPTTSHHGQLPPLSSSSCSSWQKITRPACSPLSTSRRALHRTPTVKSLSGSYYHGVSCLHYGTYRDVSGLLNMLNQGLMGNLHDWVQLRCH